MLKVKVEKRSEKHPVLAFGIVILSLAAGLAAVSIVFLFKGVNPLLAIYEIFLGSFGSLYSIKETITKAIPLILIGSGLCLVFRARFWNIGAESQLLMGSVFSTWVGLNLGPQLPSYLVIPLMFFAGFLGGAIWAFFPAVLKVKFKVNEVVSTLMLNYIAAEIVNYLIVGPWKGKTQFGFPYTDNLPESAVLPLIPGSRIHYITLIIAASGMVVLFFLLYFSKIGYEARVLGENREAARYGGISSLRVILTIMLISGGMAGLAGVGEVAGIHHHLTYPGDISSGYGFSAIIVAWLAKLNPLLVLVSGIFFAGILVGGDAIQISLKLPASTVYVFSGMILIFLIAGDYFLKYKISLQVGKK
jgi:ABC-type uncharacterized transport system permease subunit